MNKMQATSNRWPPQEGPITFIIDGSGLGLILLILFLIVTVAMILREGEKK
ncbi:hypothetical protein [Pseudophaeobacter sp.]|jgi:hypothetical protein|uniref:hypothetical protein n=1 Tax=Pseudophaeobacter sp. TaxID=1971739 RepID=UPI0032D94150